MKLIVIGSGSSAHLKLNSPFVSGYHAELLLLDNGEILLTDKGSKNGTFLNNQRLQPDKDVPVKRGDVVRFADQTLDWRNVPALPMPDFTKIKEMRGIGTNFRNKHQLQGDRVSRFHATLTRKSDRNWYIQDHSKNGTTINGKQIPSNQDIKLKRGDKILCAGVPAPNPCGEGSTIDYRKILVAMSIVLLLCGVTIGGFKIIDYYSSSDEKLYEKYKNSSVLLIGYYYFRVSAGDLNISQLGLPTDITGIDYKNDKPKAVYGLQSNMIGYTGTGFYVSNDGKIATNLHVTRPWLFGNDPAIISGISDYYKMKIAEAAVAYDLPALNAFTSQVKVEGVLSYIGMLPNGAYFSNDNIKQCRELVGHDNPEKDVAILQLDTKRLPDPSCNVVNVEQAVTNDSDIRVGSHIYTVGFPFGLNLQNLESSKGIQTFGQDGSVTKECDEYSFSFNAPSYHGASGSPIFNKKGQLIGILNAGVDKSQGFNSAIKAVYVKELLNQSIGK